MEWSEVARQKQSQVGSESVSVLQNVEQAPNEYVQSSSGNIMVNALSDIASVLGRLFDMQPSQASGQQRQLPKKEAKKKNHEREL